MKNKIIKSIENSSVGNKEDIKPLLLPGIGFKTTRQQAGQNASKIGGQPPILDDGRPVFNNKPLLFLGQITLEEISAMNTVLPRKGTLCFFILVEDIGYRYPDKKGEFKVIYIQNETQKVFVEGFPTIRECSVSFFEYYTFPSYQEYQIQKEGITEQQLFCIEEIEHEIQESRNECYTIEHQLLGHPKALQGRVRFWWSAKYLGFDGTHTFSEEETKLIQEEEENFVLLLQLNFEDPRIEVDFFGDGIAYFGIHKNDLGKHNFDNVILVMQNT